MAAARTPCGAGRGRRQGGEGGPARVRRAGARQVRVTHQPRPNDSRATRQLAGRRRATANGPARVRSRCPNSGRRRHSTQGEHDRIFALGNEPGVKPSRATAGLSRTLPFERGRTYPAAHGARPENASGSTVRCNGPGPRRQSGRVQRRRSRNRNRRFAQATHDRECGQPQPTSQRPRDRNRMPVPEPNS